MRPFGKGVLHQTRPALFVEEVNDPLPLVEAIQCGQVTHSPSFKHAAENVYKRSTVIQCVQWISTAFENSVPERNTHRVTGRRQRAR